eukprot:c8520_g1_i1 orf=59-226(+)
MVKESTANKMHGCSLTQRKMPFHEQTFPARRRFRHIPTMIPTLLITTNHIISFCK